ncbi:MAG: amino acid permease [Candidatus Aminicenantes bacterium]|nr:amino acid permease [Candidatus Aminicenantes bacterium]
MTETDRAASESGRPALLRTLGLADGIAILVGITIGAGIYSTPQIIAGYLGSFNQIISLWIAVGIFVYVGGLIYAELGTRLPEAGGEYVYVSRAFGPFAGFIFGWSQLFIIRTSPAAGLAIVTADYLGYFVRLSASAHRLVAVAVILLLGALNYAGIKRASLFQKAFTVYKTIGLFILVVGGLILVQGQASLLQTRAEPTINLGPIGNLVAALLMVFFAHTGMERLGYSAGEMKDPRKTIPLSLFLGIATLVVLYCLTNLVYHRTLGMEGVRGNTVVASATAVKLAGQAGAIFVAVLVIVSATSSINGTMMTATRAYYAMARDRLFFRWLDHIHPRFRTPSRAIMAHCVWAIVILFLRGTFEVIAAGMVFGVLIFWALNTFALFKLRMKDRGGGDSFRVPLYPVLPAVYLAGILAFLVFRAATDWRRSLEDIAFIATGIPFYFFWASKRRKIKNGPKLT